MKTHPYHLSRLAAAVLAGMLAGYGIQAAAAPLGQLDPGRVEVPDRTGVRSSATEMPGTLELPDTTGFPEAEEAPREMTALPDNMPRFLVTKVTIVGAQSYPPGTFDSLAKRLEGNRVSLREVTEVADTITQRYRKAGFLLAKAYVPQQRLEGGALTIQVFEGKVNEVSFHGPSNKTLEGYAQNIREETPPTSATIERNLLLMNDVSGNDSRAVLQASPIKDGTDLAIENTLRKYEGFVGADNRDSRYFGPWQVYGGVGVNDFTGRGDHLGVRAGRSVEGDKMTFIEGQYELPVGTQGEVVSVLAQHNDGHADTYSYLNAHSSGDTFALRYTRPWVRQRDETFKTSAAFTYYNGTSEYLHDKSLPPSSEDRIRALRLGASYDWLDSWGGKNLAKAELSQGLRIMGASSESRLNPSREEGETNFTKLRVDAQRIQSLSGVAEGLNLYLAGTAQTAFGKRLLSPEQFGVGGSEFGRGYDPSEITGDSGFAVKTELQYNRVHSFKDRAVPTQYYGFL